MNDGLNDNSSTDPFRIEVDESSGTVRVHMEGSWDIATARMYVSALKQSQARIREKFGFVKIVTDARNMAIQPQEVTAALNEAQYGAADRLAVIVSTALAKVSTRRHLENTFGESFSWQIFASEAAAELWLQA